MIKTIKNRQTINLYNTKVTAYDDIHDTNEPLYFSIENSVGEKLLYLTDCGTSEGIQVEDHDVFIIEANYYQAGILESLQSEVIHVFQYNRTTNGKGHLEILQTIDILKRGIGERAKHIILSHLSSSNGNGELFQKMASDELEFENVHIATKGLHVECGEDTNVF